MGGGGGGGRGGEGGGGRALSWMADCDFFSDFDGTLGAFPAVGSVPGGHIGLGGGLTIRPLPPSPSITFSANLGRGRIKASHHVSAESHRCLPFGRTDAVPVAARRFGVDMDALRLSLEGRLAGRRYAGAVGLWGSRSWTLNFVALARGEVAAGLGVEAREAGAAGVA